MPRSTSTERIRPEAAIPTIEHALRVFRDAESALYRLANGTDVNGLDPEVIKDHIRNIADAVMVARSALEAVNLDQFRHALEGRTPCAAH